MTRTSLVPQGNGESAGSHSDVVVERSGRHAATYWMFKHVEGLRRVPLPETALFDAEGVLEAWIYAPFTVTKRRDTGLQALDCRATRRDVLETNVLRFEARLQDLAQAKQEDTVAVQRVNEPEYLDERALDALVRILCERELAMNADVPDLRIPRKFPGGGSFCLQEFVPLSDQRLLVVRFQHGTPTLSTPRSNDREEGGDARGSLDTSSAGEHAHLHAGRYSFSTSRAVRLCEHSRVASQPPLPYNAVVVSDPLQARLRQLVQLVLAHLHVFFELQLLDITLEFAHDKTRDSIYLVGAQHIKGLHVSHPKPKREKPQCHKPQAPLEGWSSHGDTTKAPRDLRWCAGESSDTPEARTPFLQHPAPASHSNFRVCRQCRKPQDVDLAKELALKQATTRRVLAKLQSAQEERIAAQQRDLEAQEALQQHRQALTQLQRELAVARSGIEARDARVLALAQENETLKLKVADAVEEARAATTQLQRFLHAERLRQSADDHERDRLQQQQQEQQLQLQLERWEAQSAQLQTQLAQLQQELERSQHTLRKLQTKYEEVRAGHDELRFQWRFVRRKLVDVKEPGVAPPQRIAGGYRSYVSPSDANVRDVVRWIVDYDAKRAVVDAHKRMPVGKRLKLKLELMRLLGSPKKRGDTGTSAGTSGLGPKSPHRRPRSPLKRSPARRSRNAASDTPTAVPSVSKATTLLAEAAERNTTQTPEAVDKQ